MAESLLPAANSHDAEGGAQPQHLHSMSMRNGSFVREARSTADRRTGFPGWGEVTQCEATEPTETETRVNDHPLLGELPSTAICGNDITSSCFYVTGAMADAAGVWAPFGAVFAAITLWLFRWVYTEAVTALPFNGGIYNILLNTLQSKKVAALVASLTMLSYIATAVVSALSAGAYLQALIDDQKHDPMEHGNYTIHVAVVLLVFFCGLKLIGISESAAVASFMFLFHLLTMGVLIVVAFCSIALPVQHLPFALVAENVRHNFRYTGGSANLHQRIVLGFSKAMLGVSGFESSANFVEEQQPGVFQKTLRNMWYAVSILNITFIFECVFATRLEELVVHRDNALAFLALKTGGKWLQTWVCFDAFVVLAAAVLTSYVGFSGLTTRMAGDRCLPRMFHLNEKVAPIIFMGVCVSLVFILEGNGDKLGACYSFAFLTVMALFALSLFVLQMQRPKLPSEMKNNVLVPSLAFILVLLALGNSLISSADVIPVFFLYFSLVAASIIVFLFRIRLVKAFQKIISLAGCTPSSWITFLDRWIEQKRKQSCVVYFSKTANLCRLNKAIRYVQYNEDTDHCRIVHVYDEECDLHQQLTMCCQVLDAIYPSIRIDLVFVKGMFGANLIQKLSEKWQVPPSLMFITCPTSTEMGKRLQDLHGVRVIMSHEEESYLVRYASSRSEALSGGLWARPSSQMCGDVYEQQMSQSALSISSGELAKMS